MFGTPRNPASARVVGTALALLALLLAAGCSRQSPTAPMANERASLTSDGALTATITGPAVHLEGSVGPGALYALDKPADWNGDLVIYLHGYTTPGQPVALPNNGAIRDRLLAAGFAVATSSFSENGYAVAEAMRQSHQLRGLFVDQVAAPKRVFLFGVSLGGIIGMLLTEKYPHQYDGTFLASGVVGGTRAEVQYISDTKVLFDVLYPSVHLGGLFDPIPITDPNTQLIAPVVGAVTANPTNLGILNLVTRHPLAGNNGQELTTSLITVLGFQMFGVADLLDRTNGHVFFDNEGHAYTGPLPPAVTGPINAGVARYASTADARMWMEHYGEPSGELRIPVLTVHNTRDPVVPFFHEALLANAVSSRGFSSNLVQRSKDSYGHVAFTPDELVQNFQDMVHWVDTGVRPTP
jgi:alpha-beta hydrolase superfamily lysophospholipase